VDRESIVEEINTLASEFAATNGRAPSGDGDSLLQRYGFTSLDALELLLLLEERFGVTFEDEDLSEETLRSETKLADYIIAQLA
jgi:acyl carrier protein